MRHAQLVMGPAGSGKSTYCAELQRRCADSNRVVHIINLDPAAEHFSYDVALDIRDLISVDDVVEEVSLGPNGALVFCMEYLVENIEWLYDELCDFHEDDYVVFDCPGQIELYTHYTTMPSIVRHLKTWSFSCCALYLIDSTFCQSSTKFLSAALTAMSAMVLLEVPHINVLTKCDLVPNLLQQGLLDKFTELDVTSLTHDVPDSTPKRYKRLTEAIASVLEDWNMVSFVPLDMDDEESITNILAQADHAMQFGEDAEPRTRDFEEGLDNDYDDDNDDPDS